MIVKKFEFKVNIQAVNNEKAKKLLAAMFEIKKVLSDEDLLLLAEKLKKNPELIKKAKRFM